MQVTVVGLVINAGEQRGQFFMCACGPCLLHDMMCDCFMRSLTLAAGSTVRKILPLCHVSSFSGLLIG